MSINLFICCFLISRIELGQSIRTAIHSLLTDTLFIDHPKYEQDLKSLLNEEKVIQNNSDSNLKRLLFRQIERGLRGEPSLNQLKELKDLILASNLSEIETKVIKKSFNSTLILLLIIFPSLLLMIFSSFSSLMNI